MSGNNEMSCDELKSFYMDVVGVSFSRWQATQKAREAGLPAFKAHQERCSECRDWVQFEEFKMGLSLGPLLLF